VLLDAELYRDRVRAPPIVNELQASGRLPPTTCIYVAAVNGAARHTELTCSGPFAEFLAVDLVRWIEKNVGRFARSWLCGLSLSGLAAAYTAIYRPAVFQGAICQSPSAWWNDEWLAANLPRQPVRSGRFWISVGNEELDENATHPPSGLFQRTNQRDSCRRLAQQLEACCDKVRFAEFSGGHDPACWARELPDALTWLMEGSEP
jgi:enterochelin esterase family protein